MSHPQHRPNKRPKWRKDPRSSFRSHEMLDRIGTFLLGFGMFAVIQAVMRPPAETPTSNPSFQPTEEHPSGWYSPPAPSEQTQVRASSQQEPVDVADATVCVKGTLPNGTEVCASGVSIDPQLAGIDADEGSVVVTNFHVVLNTGNEPPIQLGGEGAWYASKVLKRSPDMDLALLYVPDAQLPVATLAETSPENQMPVRAIGFPNNQPLTIRDSTLLGKIQECLAMAPCLALQQGTITHGNSGGPLEADGKVIGINQGETIQEIAIPVEQVHHFLSDEVEDSDFVPPQYRGMPPGMPPGGPRGMPPGMRGRGVPFPPPYGGYPRPPVRWR
jgi:S1-C subfamily serine protease